MRYRYLALLALFLLPLAQGSDVGELDAAAADALNVGKHYSPYAARNFPTRLLWGDTHLHTNLSMDAGAFGNKLGLDDAYRFTRGEEVIASSGQNARLSRPLDWVVIADHSDGMEKYNQLIKYQKHE